MVIGEVSTKLSDGLKRRNSHIEWPAIYGMRNVIAHDYVSVQAERLWSAYTDSLGDLETVCRRELSIK